jgi:tetratricopeptide (TPR) repeat protein
MYRQLLDGTREQRDAFGIQMALNNLGENQLEEGNTSAARQEQEEALAVSRQSGQKIGIADGLCDLGQILELAGDLDAAKKDYAEAGNVFREMDLNEGVANAKSGLAAIARDQGDLSAAEQLYQQALALLLDGTNDGQIAETRLGLARVYVDEARPDESLTLAQNAIDGYNRLKRPSDEARARIVLAEALLAKGQSRRASAEAVRAVELQARTDGRLSRIVVAIGASYVKALADQQQSQIEPEAEIQRLERAASESESRNLTALAMEAHFARDAIQVKFGDVSSLPHLAALEREARAKGLLLIAQKAQAAAAGVGDRTASNRLAASIP